MATLFATTAELHDRLGGVPQERIRLDPPPGTATEADLLRVLEDENRPCELIDGVLVEKPMGYFESIVAVELILILGRFVASKNLGKILGADGALRILPEQIRAADVAFIPRERFSHEGLPRQPIPHLVPDLAVEVLSRSNTPGEMKRKLRDYFAAGVRLVWLIDAETRTAEAYSSPDHPEWVPEDGTLDGRDVLPGFTLSLRELFANAERGMEA
ncbi:MAG: Uma2 family endonuclease [Planctomycetales bacterium]